MPSPLVSTVICTRNRPAGALSAARSALQDSAGELVIVDQSGDDETESLLARELGRDAVTIVRSDPRGLAAARNVGVLASTGRIVAFTDDDCEVRCGWHAALSQEFDRDDRIGLVFGNVVAPDYDRRAGFVPAYTVRKPVVALDVSQKAQIEGMGACMAVRRTAWEALGGFDESLGTGSDFRAGEDTDFAIRALIAGWRAAETPEAAVTHHGFRTWAQGEALVSGYMYGIGAANVKMLRLAGLRAARPLAALALRWLVSGPVVDLNHIPPRLPRLTAFARGAIRGFTRPLGPGGRFR